MENSSIHGFASARQTSILQRVGEGVFHVKETFVARVISEGRVTIPDKVREILGIKEGNLLRVTVEPPLENKEQTK